jgi:two-component system phosphate regulon sensor histidine kinase PhoR
LLTLARAEGGQEEAPHDLVALDRLVLVAASDMEPLVREKELALETEVHPTIEVVGDPLRLRQLVLNLLSNAVAYTPAGGSIRVRLTAQDGTAWLTVADTGVGIAAVDLPHIFESFYRADTARSRAAGGTGLGLAIARWCAAAHGGHIMVESQPGQGSTFVVSLPMAQLDDEAGFPLPDER